MVAQSTVLTYAPMQSLDTATLSGSYLPLGTATPDEARIFKVVNDSTVAITVSIDGVTDHDILPVGSFFLYDVGTNRGNSAPVLSLQKGTQFYVKGATGTGNVYLVVLFGNSNTQLPPL